MRVTSRHVPTARTLSTHRGSYYAPRPAAERERKKREWRGGARIAQKAQTPYHIAREMRGKGMTKEKSSLQSVSNTKCEHTFMSGGSSEIVSLCGGLPKEPDPRV